MGLKLGVGSLLATLFTAALFQNCSSFKSTRALTTEASVALSPSAKSVGNEEVVFSYLQDQCDANNISDTPVRAFRDANGQVQMTMGSAQSNRRLIGPDLKSLTVDCSHNLLTSGLQSDPSLHEDEEWIHGGVYTLDGNTIYALVHNEYHGWEFYPTYCDSQSWQDQCWKTSTTLAVSTDGGVSYHHPSTYAVSWPSYPFNKSNYDPGLSAPSNFVKNQNDGYYYATIWAWNQNSQSFPVQTSGMCVIRTQNLADASSWRAWDGTGFNLSFYPNGAACATVAATQIPLGMMPTQLVYSRFFSQFMLVGYTNSGVYFLLSSDLIHWGKAELIQIPWPAASSKVWNAYAAIFDDTDPSRNFENPGQHAYLYYTRFNNYLDQNRDLVRVPIVFEAQ